MVAKPRAPNPRPLILALMAVSFLGASCSIQKMTTREVPDEVDVQKMLGLEGQGAEAVGAVVKSVRQLFEEEHELESRFKPFLVAFGVALIALYVLTFIIGSRALSLAPRAGRQLGTLCLLVLPARVAMAAVEVATAMNLRPAVRAAAGPPAVLQSARLQARARRGAI